MARAFSHSVLRRIFHSQRSRRVSTASASMLTDVIDVQPKNFERELWYIYDNIDRYPWITQSQMLVIRKKIFRAQVQKKTLNPLINERKRLTEQVTRLKSENPSHPDLARVSQELDRVTELADPLHEKLNALQEEIFQEIIFFPNCKSSPETKQRDKLLSQVGVTPNFHFPIKSHVDFQSDILFRSDAGPSSTYFLLGKAALAELAILERFEDFFLDEDFRPFSSMPDIVKGAVVIGCGSSPEDVVPILDFHQPAERDLGQSDDEKHLPKFLVGGSSLFSFAAFFTKMLFRTGRKNTGIPLHLFSTGRRYSPPRPNEAPSLFNCLQSSRVSLFGVPTMTGADEMFEFFSQKLTSCYEGFGLPFQLVEVGKENLGRSESRRQELSLWSPADERYQLCGWVSHHNDYISNRLLVNTRRANTYPCPIISGVAADVSVVLGAVMENGQREDGDWEWPGVTE